MALGGVSKIAAGLLAGAALALTSTTAMSADLYSGGLKDGPVAVNPFTWSVWAGGTSDYIFRGISQNRRDATFQGGADVSYGIFYAGTALSGVNFDSKYGNGSYDANLEVDFYAGIKPVWNGVTFDFGVITYNYPHQQNNTYDLDFVEIKAGASKTIWSDLTAGVTAYYSPDYTGENGGAWAVEGTLSKPVYKYADVDFTLSGTVGHQFFERDISNGSKLNEYTYGNVGLSAVYKAFTVDLRYWDTTLDVGEAPAGVDSSVSQAGSAVVLSAKVTY